jgi:hypothetical protein
MRRVRLGWVGGTISSIEHDIHSVQFPIRKGDSLFWKTAFELARVWYFPAIFICGPTFWK